MLEANTRSVLVRFCDNNWEKAKDVVKICCVKKHVGDGGELEHTLDDVLGIWVTVQSCYEKQIEIKKNPLQKSLQFSNCCKSI